nr:propanediol utilization protein [Rhodobacter amnigenus]
MVTLTPKGVSVAAWRRLDRGLFCHTIGHGNLPPAVLARFAHALGRSLGGRVQLRLPYPPGLGTGMSTAGLLAIARLTAGAQSPLALARACVAAEGASDPLMFRNPGRLLWAPRLGRELAALPPQPRAHLLAGFWGPPRPTQAADQNYDDVSDLVARWQAGGPLATRAALASESARRCIARRGPLGDPTESLARDLGALGWTISHSGAARALIFAPGHLPPHGISALREAGLRGVHQLVTCGG